MSILSFGQFASRRKAPPAEDWSNQELADFFRAHRLLVQNGAAIGMDRGRSDIGEPWMVFFDTSSQDVFLHIARIDGRCILVCEHLSIRLSAPQIDLLITRFEEAIRDTFALRSQRASNVVVHPAAKIIMSISAVFLLFKLDSSNTAFAKEAVAAGGAETTSRKGELALTARIQVALNRILDSADSPAAIAALASVVLAADLAFNDDVRPEQVESSQQIEALELHRTAVNTPHVASSDEVSDKGEAIELLIDAEAPLLVTSATAILANLAVQELSSPADPVLVGPTAELPHAVEQQVSVSNVPTMLAPVESKETAEAPVAGAGIDAGTAVTTVALSLQALGNAAALDWASISLSELAGGVVVSARGELLFDVEPSLGLEPQVPSAYGFASETMLEGDDLMMVLRHVISGMGRFELTSDDGVLVVEQMDIQEGDAAMLGIWSNVAADGGSIRIIGQVDLIDDVAALLGTDQLVA